jgi:RNA polymerase sigma-70 factor (ECF subfamily)
MSVLPGHYASGPEELVVSLAAKGDRTAFTELVRRRQPWLRGLLRHLSGDVTLADDLAQRVFMKVWSKIRHLKDPTRFPGWLKRVALNEWIDHQRVRKDQWHQSYDDELQPGATNRVDVGMDLDHALAALPDPVRLCVVLSYHEQLTNQEIADLSGLPLGTVKSHVRRGSGKLSEILAAYGENA